STGLGWPAERAHPQENPSYPQSAVTSPLGGEDRVVSRETTDDAPAVTTSEAPEAALEAPPADHAADHDGVLAQARVIRTAGDFAGVAARLDDDNTPLARMAE